MRRLARLGPGTLPCLSKQIVTCALSLAWLDASANLLQAGVLLAAFAALLALAFWPELGALAALIALLAVAGIAGLALRLPPRRRDAALRRAPARAREPAAGRRSRRRAGAAGRAAAHPGPLRRAQHDAQPPSPSAPLDRSAIAITEGLLRQLTMREIAAVLAREISHIGLGDLFALSIADFVTRFAQALYYLGLGLGALNLWRLLTDEELVSW